MKLNGNKRKKKKVQKSYKKVHIKMKKFFG